MKNKTRHEEWPQHAPIAARLLEISTPPDTSLPRAKIRPTDSAAQHQKTTRAIFVRGRASASPCSSGRTQSPRSAERDGKPPDPRTHIKDAPCALPTFAP